MVEFANVLSHLCFPPYDMIMTTLLEYVSNDIYSQCYNGNIMPTDS